jgi:hypothetical protein
MRVSVVELEFSGILNGNDAFAFGNKGGEDVEGSCLSRARATRDQDIKLSDDTGSEEIRHFLGEGSISYQVINCERVFAEATYSEDGAIKGKWRYNSVNSATIRESGINHRIALVNPPANRRDDAIYNVEDMLFVIKADIRSPL